MASGSGFPQQASARQPVLSRDRIQSGSVRPVCHANLTVAHAPCPAPEAPKRLHSLSPLHSRPFFILFIYLCIEADRVWLCCPGWLQDAGLHGVFLPRPPEQPGLRVQTAKPIQFTHCKGSRELPRWSCGVLARGAHPASDARGQRPERSSLGST